MTEKRNLSTRVQDLIDHFQTIPADCLSLIAKKQVNAEGIAGVELASRGLNHDGEWIGFNKDFDRTGHFFRKGD